MPRSRAATKRRLPLRTTLNRRQLPADPLSAIDLFLQRKSPVHKSLKRIVQRLKRASIDHVVVGGMAIDAYGHHRMTNDVDLLMNPGAFERFQRTLVPKYYEAILGPPRRFTDRVNQVTLDVLLAGGIPGRDGSCPWRFPEPRDVSHQIGSILYADLPTMIQMKLAARRYQDLADVVRLIEIHGLGEQYLVHLHPTLHKDFRGCLDELRRDEEFNSRN